MPKKRVHEIAKEQGLPAKELLAKLQASGLAVKAVASSVDEATALKALAGGGAKPAAAKPAQPAPAKPAAKPAAAKPAQPQAATPAKPAQSQAATPAKPAAAKPTSPAPAKPAQPQPQHPAAAKPQAAAPAAAKPAQPQAGAPAKPAQPQSGAAKPAHPQAGAPAKPAASGAAPAAGRPAQPQGGAPGKPPIRPGQPPRTGRGPKIVGGQPETPRQARGPKIVGGQPETPQQARAGGVRPSGPRGPRPGGPGKGGPQRNGTGQPADGQGKRPTRSALSGERAPAQSGGGGRRRVVIDSQASRRQSGPGGPVNQPPRRQRRGRRRRGTYEEPQLADLAAQQAATDTVRINSGSTVKETAESMGVPVPEIIKKLMALGEMATLTQTLSDEAIGVLAEEFDKKIEIVHAADDVDAEPTFEDAAEDLVPRPPVVTIMGHVDHGKTSLLDAIRKTEVAAGEAGGITQHIGAYQVNRQGNVITFLDTPGHEAFTAMRARGAKVTDLAVIVVAADDGVKPQTEEALDHAKAAEVPIVVAVNKIDKEGAQPDRVRAEMAQRGFNPSDWGGDTEFVNVSAKSREGLDDLLDTLQVVSELAELKANPSAEASGVVIESKLDSGRGAVVTILVQRGTLKVGDAVVAGAHWGRVRAMNDFLGERAKSAQPGQPIEILGFDTPPEAGEFVHVVENDRRARQLAGERANRLKTEAIARRSGVKVSLEDVFKQAKEGELKELALVLKADVSGSLEAVEDEIAKLPQQEVSVNVVHRGVGGVNESDVMLASASNGIVLGFNVRPIGDARLIAEREGVEIRSYAVIYKAIEELRDAMQGMLEPEQVEETLGEIEVRQIFRASRVGTIAGSYVTDGRITRGAKARLVRDGTVVYDGEIASLRRFNEDVREVAKDYECGVVLKDFADVKEGDVIEAYATRQRERALA